MIRARQTQRDSHAGPSLTDNKGEHVSNAGSVTSWSNQVITRVNARLRELFADKRAHANQLSPRAHELVDAVAELTIRGGKRIRALLIYAGFRASARQDSELAWEDVATLGAAIELLQSYLLMQDDWMDGDEERRGGPSTHAAFTRQVRDPQLGASLAILAGDIAIGYAFELLLATRFPQHRRADALTAFTDMHSEVVFGQQLDLLGHDEITLTHHLKTGSYTVRGPVALGALLGDATQEQLHVLENFARPLGLAFQLRDDLLGAFGDPSVTGKPVGRDLRDGKKTALLAAAKSLLSSADRPHLDRVLGNPLATPDELAAATRALERSGARECVEQELRSRLSESRNALEAGSCLHAEGTRMLRELLERLALRDH